MENPKCSCQDKGDRAHPCTDLFISCFCYSDSLGLGFFSEIGSIGMDALKVFLSVQASDSFIILNIDMNLSHRLFSSM